MTIVKCTSCKKEWEEARVLNTTEKIGEDLIAFNKHMKRIKCKCGSMEVIKKPIEFKGFAQVGKFSTTNAINRKK